MARMSELADFSNRTMWRQWLPVVSNPNVDEVITWSGNTNKVMLITGQGQANASVWSTINARLNSDAGHNYDIKEQYQDGSSPAGSLLESQTLMRLGYVGDTGGFFVAKIYLNNDGSRRFSVSQSGIFRSDNTDRNIHDMACVWHNIVDDVNSVRLWTTNQYVGVLRVYLRDV